MRGAPQRRLASAMVRTSSASSEPTGGRPVRPRRDFHVQKARNPCRCQRITVSGRTTWSASRHPDRRPPRGGSSDRPRTFDLLGFTHYWGLSRKGKWVVKRKTARDRLSRALKRVAQWCRLHRHHPIEEQQQTLAQKLRGHFGYYGITGNFEALKHFREQVVRVWRKWLGRR